MRSAVAPVVTVVALTAMVLSSAACQPRRGTIGAVLGQSKDGRLWVREVPPDLAAGTAGVREGDELLLIDGQDVRRMTSAQVHEELIGDVGDPVQLTLIRGEEVIRVKLKRTPARKRRIFTATPPSSAAASRDAGE